MSRSELEFVLVDSTIEAAVLFGLWLLLVGNTSQGELLVGAVCALLGAVGDALVKASGFARFYVRLKEVAQALMVPWFIVRDTFTVASGVVRRVLTGRNQARWLELKYARTADTEADRADRALATALTTMSPNEIVVGIDRKKKRIYLHQFVAQPASATVKNLGAKE